MAKNRPAPSNPSKGSSKKKKKKITTNKLLSGPNSVAMKPKSPLDNPFETIWSRRKFDILGKKRKGEEKRVGLARSRGLDKRKKTLLKEYEQSNKASVFVDKRIGEQNGELGEYDKAILRRKHQFKVNKPSKYNLSDGEEDEFADEGGGSFSGRDDFDDDVSQDDDDDVDETEKKSVILKQLSAHNVHDPSGLAEGEENKHKSKKEVMAEVISKSKYFKAEKAKNKEENVELTEELDQSFTTLVQSNVMVSLTQPRKMNALNALLYSGNSKELMKKDELSAPAKADTFIQDKPDDYDKLVKGLALERRASASDRIKTPEEIAQEEREHLERLEKDRQQRMGAKDDSSDEEDDGPDDYNKPSVKKLRSMSGDDLGDSFTFDEDANTKKSRIAEILERGGSNVEKEDGESSENSDIDEDESDHEDDGSGHEDDESDEDDDEPGKTSLKDWEQSDDDNLTIASEEDEDDDDEVKELNKASNQERECNKSQLENQVEANVREVKASGKKSQTKQEDLPFVIQVPNNLEELCSLLDNRTDAEVMEAVNRIRKCNAVKLAAENRKKMQVFYGVLLQYFASLATKKPLKFNLLNLLVKPLLEMSMDTPYFAAICARQRILRTRTQFCEDIKNPDKSCWPSLKTLFLLRLWSVTFPCSDFRHVVMTPSILLMSEYLIRCPIRSGRDTAIGSFLCSMLLSVAKQSKKFCPEAIIFLQSLLMSASESGAELLNQFQLSYSSEHQLLKPWLQLQNNVSDIHPLDFLTVMDMPEDSSFYDSDDFRASVLVSVTETLRGFVNIYEGYSSFAEIFVPVAKVLHEVVKQETMPGILQESMKDVAQMIEKKADEQYILRQPLQMRKKKPESIKLLNPKFEENFVKGRDYDPDRQRAETKKLKKLLKQEEKGARRELRKDNLFLLGVKQKEKARLAEERAEKYGMAKAFLQEQEHAYKSGQLGRGGKKRRR